VDNRKFESGASASPPSPPVSPSSGYPTNGNPGTGAPATVPGEWWFHQVGEELRGVIEAAGLTPDYTSTTQLLAALSAGWGMDIAPGQGRWEFPGGFKFKWGETTAPAATSGTVTFPLAFPNACFSVLLIDMHAPGSVNVMGLFEINAGGFTWIANVTNVGLFRWTAFGY
jgi:hypothetical protein